LSAISDAVTTAVLALHVVALVVGGGFALARDRVTLAARHRPEGGRLSRLSELGATHRTVGTALAISVATGATLFFFHAERYLLSGIFWVKMALVVALAGNALVMQVAERNVREAGATTASPQSTAHASAWRQVVATAQVSSVLWILVAIAGTIVGEIR